MNQTLFTVILPLCSGVQGDLTQRLSGLKYTGKAPNNDVLGFSQITMLHYASLFLYDDAELGWQLIFESNIDNDIPSYFQQLVAVAKQNNQQAAWLDIFQCCEGFESGTIDQLPAYLLRYVNLPSAGYSGCVGRSRDQVLLEAHMHQLMSAVLDELPPNSDAIAAVSAIREAIGKDSRFADLHRIPADTPDGAALMRAQSLKHRPTENLTTFETVLALLKKVWSALKTACKQDGLMPVAEAVWAGLVFVAMALWNQIRKEPSAEEDKQRPNAAHVREQQQYEDFLPTNHMVSVVSLHTDSTRRWAKKSAFKILDTLARYEYTKGLLGNIPTIHFAHWATINEGKRLLFVSNFDGSWDSYLDDFTLKAAAGLTLAWAHCKGMPKSKFMVLGGAAKGPQFIDWARRSMVPTLVWYNAYPHLSIRNINRNSALRQAFVKDTNGTNAGNWLELIR
ncbi:MAG: hypothetical protein MI808_22410 [Pseudomonadales bacterium]|nr:hypothetical protein [Pseudomonadales bacterium]